jgi:hypothetical protein
LSTSRFWISDKGDIIIAWVLCSREDAVNRRASHDGVNTTPAEEETPLYLQELTDKLLKP